MSNGILVQAQMLTDQEQYEQAYSLLTGVYDKLKTDPEYLEKTALLAKTLEKEDEAMKYWEELVSVDPNSLIGYSELLDIYINKDKYKYYLTRAKYKILNEKVTQAIDDYKKAISSTDEPEKIVNVRFLLAKSYEYLNKTQEAVDEYHKLLEQKEDPAVYHKLADMYAQTGDRYSAINVLEKALKTFPDSGALSEYLSALYLKEGVFDKAFEYAKSDFSKIKSLLMKGDNEKAFEMLSQVTDKNNPNYPALTAEYYFNIKDWENCKKYIEELKAFDNQNPLCYQMSALVCDATGDGFGYHYNMGRCYSYRQNYDLAIVEYLNAHRADASRSEAVKEIIKINELKGDKTSLAEFYEKLVRLEPENYIALKGLGDIYFDLYEHRQAMEYYEKAQKYCDSDYDIYQKLALCSEKLKNTPKAVEYYEKYLEKAPLSPDTEKIKEKLSKMKSSPQSVVVDNEEGFIDKILKFFGK